MAARLLIGLDEFCSCTLTTSGPQIAVEEAKPAIPCWAQLRARPCRGELLASGWSSRPRAPCAAKSTVFSAKALASAGVEPRKNVPASPPEHATVSS